MPALPILKLPTLVLMKILRTIDIETVIPISLCSRKMCHLVKNFRDKTHTLRFEMHGEEGSSVGVRTPDYYYHGIEVVVGKKEKPGNIERVNISGHLVPIDRSRKLHVWNTYWNDREKGIQSVIEYLSDLFGIKKVSRVTVTPFTFKLLDIVKERQGNDYELIINHQLSEEESHFILEKNPAKVIKINELPDNFPIGKYLQTVHSLSVDSKLSITVDDLLNMNCVELFLHDNRFTGTEIKRILQHWAIGGFQRLKYLRLGVSDFNLEDVLGELTHTRMTEQRGYKSAIEHSTFSARDHLITRNDGVVASFRYDPIWDVFDYVQFGVWPDSEGTEY